VEKVGAITTSSNWRPFSTSHDLIERMQQQGLPGDVRALFTTPHRGFAA